MSLDNLKKAPAFQKILDKLPNKFILVGCLYLFYMLFFDNNNYISQFKMWSEIHTMKKEKLALEKSLNDVKQQRNELFTDKKSLEKFAREKYLMKREGETVFVIVEK